MSINKYNTVHVYITIHRNILDTRTILPMCIIHTVVIATHDTAGSNRLVVKMPTWMGCVCVCGMRATPPVGLRMCLGSHPPHVVTDTVVVG